MVLLALPALMEKSHPNHNDQAVDYAQGRRKELGVRFFFYYGVNDLDGTNDETNNGWRNQPARIMDQPGKVEAKLLSIVATNIIKWLHVVEEALAEHAFGQAPPVLHPGGVDELAFGHVHGEMINYHTTFLQVIHIKLLIKRFHNDALVLATIELVKLVGCVTYKRHCTVLFRYAALNFEDFTHEINSTIIEVYHDYHSVTFSLNFVEV